MKQTEQRSVRDALRSTVSVVLLTAMSISAVLYLIWQRHSVDVVMKDIDRLTRQRSQLQLEINRMQRNVESLSRFSRISRIAKNKFNMIPGKQKPMLIVVNRSEYEADLAKLSATESTDMMPARQQPAVQQAGL